MARIPELVMTFSAAGEFAYAIDGKKVNGEHFFHAVKVWPARLMFTCPVCKWPEIEEDPSHHTYEICPCCGTEYGYDDFTATHSQLRYQWLAGGMKWWSVNEPPPEGWDPVQQMYSLT